MPCFLFTYHTYRTWMPDHPRGYTKRGEGYQDPDPVMAQHYDERANHDDEVLLDNDLQRKLIDESIIASQHQRLTLHAVFTEPSHIHVLASWSDGKRSWLRVRASLKSSLSRRLNAISRNERNGTFLALSRGASRKRVKDRGHFDYLIGTYAKKHGGMIAATQRVARPTRYTRVLKPVIPRPDRAALRGARSSVRSRGIGVDHVAVHQQHQSTSDCNASARCPQLRAFAGKCASAQSFL